MKAEREEKREGERDGPAPLPWPERVVGALGLLMLLAVLGLLLHQGLVQQDMPPDIAVEAEAVTPLPSGNGFLVAVAARNTGGHTATAVQILGELREGDRVVESSLFQLDYVPDHSERRGGLFFRHDPRALRLELRATGYAEP